MFASLIIVTLGVATVVLVVDSANKQRENAAITLSVKKRQIADNKKKQAIQALKDDNIKDAKRLFEEALLSYESAGYDIGVVDIKNRLVSIERMSNGRLLENINR